MKSPIAIAAAAALTTGFVMSGASAADYTMKIGFATFKDVQHEWSNRMKAAIEKKSNGKIEVQLFPKSQLGAIPRQIDGVRLGTQQAFVAPADFFSGLDSRFGVFSIPTLFRDKQHAARTINYKELNAEILTLGADKGIKTSAIFTHSTAHYLAKTPIRKLSDFQGKKFRVNATPAEREKMRLFGASAVPMPLSEVVPALQRGVVDGTQSGTVVYVIFKFNRISKVLTRTDDTLIISTAVMSPVWLKKLPSDLRNLVLDTARELQRGASEFSDQSENFMIKKWKDAGGELISLSAGDLAKIRSMLSGVGEKVTRGDPKLHAFYQKVKATAAKY
ncbi:MAG: TRAP transporter substrate-binding protein [Alphaproteobacteria bacterium]